MELIIVGHNSYLYFLISFILLSSPLSKQRIQIYYVRVTIIQDSYKKNFYFSLSPVSHIKLNWIYSQFFTVDQKLLQLTSPRLALTP